MAEKATIHMELPYVPGRMEDFESKKVELAGFEWHVSGQLNGSGYSYGYNFTVENVLIHCTPVGEMKNSIWNCETFAQLVAFASSDPAMQRSKLWSNFYDFRQLNNEPMKVDFRSLFPQNANCIFAESGTSVFKLDLQLNVLSHKNIDLSARDNAMIASSDDAAQVKVGEETLYLSKSILSANSHFFKAFFNSDLKEKHTGVYELKEIDLKQFFHFVSLLYGLRAPIDGDSVEYLLKLADYFQCDVIIDRCRDYLFHSDELSCAKKLKLADRYNFFGVVVKVVQEMSSGELKNSVPMTGFSSSTYEALCKRWDDFVH